jgi:DNA-binding NarL/FixJ family response regulator
LVISQRRPFEGKLMGDQTAIRVHADVLRDLCVQALHRMDVPADDAWITTAVLLTADLRGIDSHGVARLVAALGEEAELTPIAAGSLVEPLTDREIEVLRLVAAGLSNPEIAEELYIALSTVKSRISHIFGKLAVENRVPAINRARSLVLQRDFSWYNPLH